MKKLDFKQIKNMLGIFLDSETNGLDPFVHDIIEIGFKIVDLENSRNIFSYQNIINISETSWNKSDRESLKINGFSYDLVQKGKTSQLVKKEIIEIFQKYNLVRKKAVFICQNPSFDRIFFTKIIPTTIQEKNLWPYHWLDLASMYFALCTKKINKFEGFSKDQIAQSLNLPPEQKPHRAINGVDHLILCYKHLIGYSTLENI